MRLHGDRSPNYCKLPKIIALSGQHHRQGERERRRYEIPGAQHCSALVSRLLVRAGRSEDANIARVGPRINQLKVVSAKAYTQGLVWQIAGAHPMGYSNLQFGYWSRDPHDPNDPSDHPLPVSFSRNDP